MKQSIIIDGKPILTWLVQNVIIVLIIALVAGIIAPFVYDHITYKHEKEQLLDTIKNICIGCDKGWLDNKLGPPKFSCVHEKLTECLYVTEYAAIRSFFNNDTGNCEAFFTTLLKNNSIDSLELPEVYSWISGDKNLGDFAYNEIEGSPSEICGYVGNGVVNSFYGECYYYGGAGNYYEFYFATEQYGKNLSGEEERTAEFSMIDEAIIDEKEKERIDEKRTFNIMQNRKQSKPNTFGISGLPYDEIIDLLMDYDGFDSLQMRMENN